VIKRAGESKIEVTLSSVGGEDTKLKQCRMGHMWTSPLQRRWERSSFIKIDDQEVLRNLSTFVLWWWIL